MEDVNLCLIGEHLECCQDCVRESIRPGCGNDGYVDFASFESNRHRTDQRRRGRWALPDPVDRRAGGELHGILSISQQIGKIDLEVVPKEDGDFHALTSQDIQAEVLVVGGVQGGIDNSSGDSNGGTSCNVERNNTANSLSVGPKAHPIGDGQC